MAATARIWSDAAPHLDILTEQPAVEILGSDLRVGMVVLDFELKTPGAYLDSKLRTPPGSGLVSFLTYDYDGCSYEYLGLHTNTTVWVAAQ